MQNLTEAMTTGGRSAAGFSRSAAGLSAAPAAAGFGRSAARVRVRTRELHCYLIAMDSQVLQHGFWNRTSRVLHGA